MSFSVEELILEKLTVDDWVSSLQRHYLSSDGPYGDAPLDSLDATPAELRTAIGAINSTDEQVLQAFMSIFTRYSVGATFGKKDNLHIGLYAYNRFHFLVLSCLVTATSIGAGDNNNFRDRLGELLNDGFGPEQKVHGINSLWEVLTVWINQRINNGELYRKIILPDPGNMSLIGYAVNLAYPSRADRTVLKNILQILPGAALQSRYALVQYLYEKRFSLPTSMRQELLEIKSAYSSNIQIEQHRFWRLIESVLVELEYSEVTNNTLLWSVSLSFGGWDSDEVFCCWARGNRRAELNKSAWEGDFEQLLGESKTPVQIKKLLSSGCIILFESRDGYWTQDDRKVLGEPNVIIVTRVPSISKELQAGVSLNSEWLVSQPMSLKDALAITSNQGIAEAKHSPPKYQVEGGVSLGSGKWLGRIGFLPKFCVSTDFNAVVTPATNCQLFGNYIQFETPIQKDSQWTVSLQASKNSSSFPVVFLKDSPRAVKWAQRPTRLEQSIELCYDYGAPLAATVPLIKAGVYPNRLADTLEAIYSRAGAPRAEKEIISLIEPVISKKSLAWDVLRSLEEAGWLEQDLNPSWRGRLWRVLPPCVVFIGEGIAHVEGAVAACELDLLNVEAKKLNVVVNVNADLPLAVPVICLSGENITRLAEKLNWPAHIAKTPLIPAAPHCWPVDQRTALGRELAGIWNPSLGLFLKDSCEQKTSITLYRFTREDDRDVYQVTGGAKDFYTHQRNIAILEYSRQSKKAVYTSQNSMLIRQGSNGYLPLPIARWLRRSTGKQSGPHQSSIGTYSYSYAIDDEKLNILVTLFGHAIRGYENIKNENITMLIAQQRHRGMRLSTYDYSGGSHCE